MVVRPLFCTIRKKNVTALPEEQVRVQMLEHLVYSLGFPAESIAVERELSGMPHLQTVTDQLPLRRADIVCFAKNPSNGDLFPLLLVECKAVKLTQKMVEQVVGYNHFLKAAFLALVNQNELRLGWFDCREGEYRFIASLPTYDQLLSCLRSSLKSSIG